MDIKQIVTDKIIASLENGIIPWEKDWVCGAKKAHNRISNKPYSLLNRMMLMHDGEYASFKQWQSLGGKVKKGEKAEIVVFWSQIPVKENVDGEEITKLIPMLRYFNVFHISQVEGVEPKEVETLPEGADVNDKAEELLMGYIKREGINLVQEQSNEAYFMPSKDVIHLPNREQFKSTEGYYGTAFHEAVHSTGTENRLNRKDKSKISSFGSEEYSKEELVAEIGSAMILMELGMNTDKSDRNNSAYIQSWLKALKNDKNMIVSASGKAEKAVDFIYGR